MNFMTKTILVKVAVSLGTALVSLAFTKAAEDAFLNDDTNEDSTKKSIK